MIHFGLFRLPSCVFCFAFSLSVFAADKASAQQATSTAMSASMHVAPDLDQRLAKFRRVDMPFHDATLTDREKKMVNKLVDACQYLEEIYWRQMDPDGLTLYQSLLSSKDPQDIALRRYLD